MDYTKADSELELANGTLEEGLILVWSGVRMWKEFLFILWSGDQMSTFSVCPAILLVQKNKLENLRWLQSHLFKFTEFWNFLQGHPKIYHWVFLEA